MHSSVHCTHSPRRGKIELVQWNRKAHYTRERRIAPRHITREGNETRMGFTMHIWDYCRSDNWLDFTIYYGSNYRSRHFESKFYCVWFSPTLRLVTMWEREAASFIIVWSISEQSTMHTVSLIWARNELALWVGLLMSHSSRSRRALGDCVCLLLHRGARHIRQTF